jgi:TonB family protein
MEIPDVGLSGGGMYRQKMMVVLALGLLASIQPALAQTPDANKPAGRETYPAGSVLNHEEGVTVLSMCVETDGRPTSIKVEKSSGFKRLDQKSVASMKRQRLTPARDADGKPVRVCDHKITLEWKLH